MPFTLPGYVTVAARFNRSDGDVVVNTFAFKNAALGNEVGITGMLDEFYFGPVASEGGARIIDLLSERIIGGEYYFRDADQLAGTPGREYSMGGPFNPEATVPVLPPDLAVCASYRGALPTHKRRRGRIYLGPLSRDVDLPGLAYSVHDENGRVSAGTQALVNAAAARLAASDGGADYDWVIASRAGNSATPIVRGYCDQHFDTQRRRDPGTQTFGRHPDDWTVSGA